MEKILVFGASSKLAQETLKNFTQSNSKIMLAGSSLDKLEIVKNDLKTRNPEIDYFTYQINALEFENHETFVKTTIENLGGLDIALIAHGTLPDNEAIRSQPDQIIKEFNINATSVFSLSTLIANYFEKQGKGKLAVISSVAGERGRQSNYIYGSAKGAVSLFLQGLRNRLINSGVDVITIKPGMVDTPMTAHMPKGLLFANAKSVGKGIYNAIRKGKDVAYIPRFWKLIMFIIKSIPESIFKKLKL